MGIKSKKGSEIVSASLVIPLVFACIFAVYSYAFNLHEKVVTDSKYRIQKREAAMIDGMVKKGEADFIRHVDAEWEDQSGEK